MSNNFFLRQINNLRHFGKYAYTLPFHWKSSGIKYNPKNTTVVFAQPRGGSTWFTDLLCSAPNTIKIDGPLYQGPFIPDGNMPSGNAAKLKSFHQLGLHYHQYLPDDAVLPDVHDFFHRLFSQGFYTPYIFQETLLRGLLSADHFVFKFYHASLMMPWLVRNFDVKPIFLTRNPFAVVASQLTYPAFADTLSAGEYTLPKFPYSDFFEPYQQILASISQPEEILAARWCLNYQPLISRADNNTAWLTVSYEALMLHKGEEIKRVFEYLDSSVPQKLSDTYDKPSISTNKSPHDYTDPKAHLTKWKNVLTDSQIKNIQRILDLFEVEGYGQELEPDYSYLYNDHNSVD